MIIESFSYSLQVATSQAFTTRGVRVLLEARGFGFYGPRDNPIPEDGRVLGRIHIERRNSNRTFLIQTVDD